MGAAFVLIKYGFANIKNKAAAKRGTPTCRRMESAPSFGFPVPLLCFHFQSGERQPALQGTFTWFWSGPAPPIFKARPYSYRKRAIPTVKNSSAKPSSTAHSNRTPAGP